MMNKRVILIEDEQRLLDLMLFNLKDEEYDVVGYKNGESFFKDFVPGETGVVITDVRLPGIDGVELLSRLNKENPEIPVIIITAFGSIDQAVSSIKTGAYDYLTKPVTIKVLKETIERALLFVSSIDLKAPNFPVDSEFITRDPVTRGQCELAAKVSPIKVPVLILGETGTGKELIAELIHNASNRQGELVKINCAAIPSELLEGELFGYKKGAFTSADRDYEGKLRLAHKGTVFLDEIGDMPEPLQAKLLRVLETESFYPIGDNQLRKVDIRVIAATNKDIKEEVERGSFRADLYYRLAVVPIKIPPLRERKGDIRLIAQTFFNELLKENKTRSQAMEQAVFTVLENHDWPGNVRELRNVVTFMALLSQGKKIAIQEIPAYILNPLEDQNVPATYAELKEMKKLIRIEAISNLEMSFIRNALLSQDWNVSKTAAAVGIDRRQLQNMMKKYGIEKP